MLKTIFQVGGTLIFGVIGGYIGMVIGAVLGGNFATSFVFFDLRGYEATGMIGFILFGLAGLITSWRWLTRKPDPAK